MDGTNRCNGKKKVMVEKRHLERQKNKDGQIEKDRYRKKDR